MFSVDLLCLEEISATWQHLDAIFGWPNEKSTKKEINKWVLIDMN